MFFDPATSLLVILAFMSGRVRGQLLIRMIHPRMLVPSLRSLWDLDTWRRRVGDVRRRWRLFGVGLVVTAVCGVAALFIVEVVGLLLMVATHLLLFGLFLRIYGRGRTPNRRYVAQLGVAGLWHLWFHGLALNQTPVTSSGHGIDFWFVDFFARIWSTRIYPLLEGFGLEVSQGAILDYLVPVVGFLSGDMQVLHFAWSFIAAGLLYRMVAPDVPELPSLPPRRLAPPRWLTGVMVLMAAAYWLRAPELTEATATVLRLLTAMLASLHVVSAVGLLTDLSVRLLGRGRGLFVVGLAVMLCVLHPDLWWVVLAWGVLGAVLGVRELKGAQGAVRSAWDQHTTTSMMRFRWRMGLVLGLLLHSMMTGGEMADFDIGVVPIAAQAAVVEEPARPVEPPDLPSLQAILDGPDGRTYVMDRFEYPNRWGLRAQAGLTPAEAEARCAEHGQHLCTSREWSMVCSDGGRQPYVLKGEKDRLFSNEVLENAKAWCNIRSVGDDGLLRYTLPWRSGTGERCRGRLAVYDLIGNLAEWVRIPDRPELWGVIGSSYLYADQRLIRCDAPMIVFDAWVSLLDLRSVGFRCCGTATR